MFALVPCFPLFLWPFYFPATTFKSDTESDTRAEISEHVGARQMTCKPAVVEGKRAKDQIRSFRNIRLFRFNGGTVPPLGMIGSRFGSAYHRLPNAH
jgi:hypothetical protein